MEFFRDQILQLAVKYGRLATEIALVVIGGVLLVRQFIWG